MDRETFLGTLGDRIRNANAQQEEKLRKALARSERLKQVASIVEAYDDGLKSHNVKTSLNASQASKLVSWTLSYADSTSVTLSVKDNDVKQELDLDLSLFKSGKPAVYVPLPFGHAKDEGHHIESKAASMRLDDEWSAEAFEGLIQDLIAEYLDDATRHGGTALQRPEG